MTTTILEALKAPSQHKERIKAVLADMHRTATIWYSYLVGIAVTVKASVDDINSYVPPKVQHIVLGGATALVIADKIRRSIGATSPTPTPPELP